MRVLCVDSNHPVLHETLRSAGHICDLLWDTPVDDLLKVLPGYDALVIRSRFRIDRQVIDRCPKLKCIGRVGAGMENIDVAYATTKNIRCLCVPEGNRDAVGEHALGMLLMLFNNLRRADTEVRRGIWHRALNRGVEIRGKTVGIIGYGYMGSAFAEKLAGLGCNVLAYDKYKRGFGNDWVREATLDQLFETCDVLSLHVPLTDETRYLVDHDFLRRFANPIYIINTARGQCLHTAHLVAAIEQGRVLGACLDVLEYESTSFETITDAGVPEPFKYLMTSDKVVLSPHIAGWTHESNYRMSQMIAEKMIGALAG